LSDDAGQSSDGVGIDADQAPGGSDAAALVEVLEHGEGLLLGEMAVEQGRALALGEAVFAGLAVEQPDVVLLTVAGADGEVAGIAPGEYSAQNLIIVVRVIVTLLVTPAGPPFAKWNAAYCS